MTYTYRKLEELIEALEACEILGLYYEVKKEIETNVRGIPEDVYRLVVDL